MMPRKPALLVLLGTLTLRSSVIYAASGTEGAAFLDIPVGAGPAALGSAYSAMATNAYAPVWNPAGLGFLTAPEVSGQHLSYLESIHYEFASVVLPLGAKDSHGEATRALGASVQYLGSGDIVGTDQAGAPTGDFTAHYGAYSLSYGQKLTDQLALGITGKIINAKLANVSANAYAADLGSLYKINEKLQLAATVTNAGSNLKFTDQSDPLPLTFHVSAAYQPIAHWEFLVEGLHDRSGKTNGRFGTQWHPIEPLALRAGYRSDATSHLSALAGFSTGIGLHLWGQEFAYAWLPYGDLGDTQYFSLLLHFGPNEAEKRNLVNYQNIRSHRSAKSLTYGDREYEQLMMLLNLHSDTVAQTTSEATHL